MPTSRSPKRPRSARPGRPAGRGRLAGLGQALRWLRERRGSKQYQFAEKAGITKGMLSAYETGKQSPSLETLEKLLDTLDCDLNDLHNAIQIVNGTPEALRRWEGPRSIPGAPDLSAEEEKALAQIQEGFHNLIRHWHLTLANLRSRTQP